ncbi:MAG: CopG family antitoxin [Bacillota bacterium]
MRTMVLKNRAEKKTNITVKIQPTLLKALKKEAARRGMSYNALLREYVAEKLRML